MKRDYKEDAATGLRYAKEMLAQLPGSRERSLVQTKIDEAELWLSRCAEEPEA